MHTSTSRLSLPYLKVIWETVLQQREGIADHEPLPHNYVTAAFDALGIGLEPTYQYLYSTAPTFEDFEAWIADNGHPSQEMIQLVNKAISSATKNSEGIAQEYQVLDAAALQHWDKEGYVIIPNVISKEDCDASVRAIQETIAVDPLDKSTWYTSHPLKNGIMVQLFRHPQLDKNRFSKKIANAYRQLWQNNDLIISRDRVSFNPPENEQYSFPGPNLHWDVSLKQPIPYGIQGLLYLTDTPAHQGAFTLVPGFHQKIDDWLHSIPPDVNPRTMDLQSLGATPIAANAVDFIIWNHKLPHGSSPNVGSQPRIVQYINYLPIHRDIETEWI